MRTLAILLLLITVLSGAGSRDARADTQTQVIVLTTGSTWVVPDDWNSASNTIEVIGGGGGGGDDGSLRGGGGGGGGGYSKITNLSLTPGASVAYQIGTGGATSTAGGDTYFNGSGATCAAQSVCAKGGGGGVTGTGGAGGASSTGIGTIKNSGGQGGTSDLSPGSGGGGGGGPHGDGKNGGSGPSSESGGGGAGGGGANNGSNGANCGASNGGNGGNNRSGSGGGSPNGGSGSSGGGGAGGNNNTGVAGGTGSQDDVWIESSSTNPFGPGGGGGGGGSSFTTSGNGGNASAGYGGGGGGAGDNLSSGARAGFGRQGIVVITYTPSSPSFSLSGMVYTDTIASTTAGAGYPITLKMGSNATTSTTTSANGSYTFTGLSGASSTTPFTVYVNGSSTVLKATTFVMGADGTSDITNVRLIKDTFMSMSTSTSGSVDLDELKFFDAEDDADVLYSAPGTTTASTSHLYATTTIYGNFIIATGTTLAPAALVVKGDYTNNGTFDANNGVFDVAGEWKSMGGFDLNTVVYNDTRALTAAMTYTYGLTFNNDGTKLYASGYNSGIYEYTLSAPYDTSTAVLRTSFTLGFTFPGDIVFNQNGTKLFVAAYDSTAIREYTLTTPYDVSTMTFDSSFSVAAKEATVYGLDFNPDGTKMFITGYTSNQVHEYHLSTAFDVSTAVFDSSFSVVSQSTNSTSLKFSEDGTYMFVNSWNQQRVYQYGLATPYDVSTSIYHGSYLYSAVNAQAYGMALNPDGTKMYLSDTQLFSVDEFGLEAPFSLAPYYKSTYVLYTGEAQPESIQFSNDGTKFFVVGTALDRVARYDMTVPYDVTTASLHSSSSLAAEQIVNAQGTAFNSDGTKIFFSDGTNSGPNNDPIAEYSMSSPYDLTTMSFVASTSVTSQEPNVPGDIEFNNDGTKLFLVGQTSAAVYEYTLSTPYSISTLSYVDSFSVSAQDTAPNGLAFNAEGTKMFVAGNTSDEVNEYRLSTAFDVSTAVFDNVFSVAAEQTEVQGLEFNADGTMMHVVGKTGTEVNQYHLPEKFETSDVLLSGTMTGMSAFENLRFSNADAIAEFGANASSTSFSVFGSTTTVQLPPQFTVAGDYYNGGILDANEGTIYMTGADMTISGTTTGTSTFNHVVAQSSAVVANDGVTWTPRSAAEQNAWFDVAYGNGTYVAVASNGTNRVMTSPDGINWTARSAAEANQWRSVAYGNGLFVAVSIDGTNRVMTSPDGINWAARSAASAALWSSVIFANGIFVALSESGTATSIMTSSDGITWTSRTTPSGTQYNALAYGNGTFVAVAYTSTNRVMTSPDAVTWSARSADTANWESVTYGNGLFVAVATSSTSTLSIMTSPDGSNWTIRTAPGVYSLQSVTYGNGLFVAVSADGTDRVMTSPDGINWTAQSAAENITWRDVAFYNGSFIAVGGSSGTNLVMTSDSGPMRAGTVTFANAASTSDLSIVGTTTNLVAPATTLSVGGNYTNTDGYFTHSNGEVRFSGRYDATPTASGVMTGTTSRFSDLTVGGENGKDGSMWATTTISGNNDSWYDVTYANGLFVAVSDYGHSVATSTNGVSWSATSVSNEDEDWYSITYGNGVFVAVGSTTASVHPSVMYSYDATAWTTLDAVSGDEQWNFVTYGEGLFVAVGSVNNRVMTSPDGITWTARSAAGDDDQWYAVTYGNGQFVAVGSGASGDHVMTSPDGITWTARSAAGDNDNWRSITYAEGLFVAVGTSGDRVMTSPDGIAWTARSAAGDDDSWQEVEYGEGLFVAVSISGDLVMTSPDGITWTARSAAGDDDTWRALAYGNGRFVAMGYNGDRAMVSSSTSFMQSTTTFASNASTSEVVIATSSSLTAPSLLTVTGDYANYGTFQNNGGTVYFGDSTTTPTGDEGFDTSIFVHDWTLSTSAYDASMNGIAVSQDGSKLFMVGMGNDTVYRFDLAIPNDLSTATFHSSTSVAAQETTPYGLEFSPDGMRMYVSGFTSDNVIQYNLTAPFDISAPTVATSVASRASQAIDIVFNNDGTQMFVSDILGGTDIISFALAVPYELTTARFDSTSSTTIPSTAGPTVFNGDGTRAIVFDRTTGIDVYDLSRPYDLSTMVRTSTSSVPCLVTGGYGMSMNGSGSQLFFTSQSSDVVCAYSLRDVAISGNATGTSALNDVVFVGENVRVFAGNASTTDLTIATSSTLASHGNVSVAGDFVNSGTYLASGATTTFSSTTAQTISGTLTATSSMGNVVFEGSGTKTFASNASTTNITIASSTTVVAPSLLTIQGNYANSGTFTAGSGVVYLSPTTTATTTHSGGATGTSAWNNVVVAGRETNDGATWTARSAAEANSWNSVTYGNGLFVAVAGSGSNRVMTSSDGITWTARSAAAANTWQSVTYGNGLFVAVSIDGVSPIMKSPDGVTWTSVDDGVSGSTWYAITYGNGLFVAVANSGSNRVMTSPDGITWTMRSAIGNDDTWRNVVYGKGKFVAVASSGGTDYAMSSTDGINWVGSTAAENNSWYGLVYGNGLFVATTYNGTHQVMTSPDGVTWTSRSGPGDNDGWFAATYGNGLFLAVGDTNDRVMTSPDGINWTARTATELSNWYGVTYGNGAFVAVSSNGTNRVMTSSSTALFPTNTILASNASTTNFTIASSSSTTAPSRLSISGNYTNYGTFNANFGTTSFNGTAEQTASGFLSATSSFFNLEVMNTTATTTLSTTTTVTNNFYAVGGATVAFPAGATTTVANLIWEGIEGDPLVLRSTTHDTQWKLNAAAQQSVSRVDVEDSDACPGIDIAASNSTDSGNNTCWTIGGAAGGGSASQTFQVGQATTSIQTVTITDSVAPTITAANDIRIAIATSTHNMRWDTYDTTPTFGGTASGKVSGTVSYEGGGSVLVVNVTSNFAASDTLTISDLSFAQFASATPAASALDYYFDGTSDTTIDAEDAGTIAIYGSLTATAHDVGQASNIFSYQNVSAQPLYRFKLTPSDETATVGTLTLSLSGVKKVTSSNLTNIALYRDYNADGAVDGGDAAIGGTGVLTVGGDRTGTIVFSTSWSATTTLNYIVIADTVALPSMSQMNVVLDVSGTVQGGTSLVNFTPTGSVASVQHARGGGVSGNGGSSGAIGGDAPAGQGTTTGGGDGGGEEIGSAPGFQAPTANGTAHNEWTNGGSGYSSDGAYATAASTNLRQSYSVFGFSVPGGNTVTGIEVKLEASGSTAAGTVEVALSWDGDSTVTATKATSVLTGSDVVYTLGGAADTWGRSWTPTELSNANFFVRVVAQPDGNTVRVDAIQVKPHHAAGGGGGGGGGEI